MWHRLNEGLIYTGCVSTVQIQPVLEIMEEVMMGLPRALDGRVYVAVGRGLWDFTSKEIYDYVEGLQEGKENKVSAIIFYYVHFDSFSK